MHCVLESAFSRVHRGQLQPFAFVDTLGFELAFDRSMAMETQELLSEVAVDELEGFTVDLPWDLPFDLDFDLDFDGVGGLGLSD